MKKEAEGAKMKCVVNVVFALACKNIKRHLQKKKSPFSRKMGQELYHLNMESLFKETKKNHMMMPNSHQYILGYAYEDILPKS